MTSKVKKIPSSNILRYFDDDRRGKIISTEELIREKAYNLDKSTPSSSTTYNALTKSLLEKYEKNYFTSNLENPYYKAYYKDLSTQTSDDNNTIFDSIWSGIEWAGEKVVNFFDEIIHLPQNLWYAHNMANKKLAEQAVDIDISKIDEIRLSNDDLEKIIIYNSLLDLYKKLLQERALGLDIDRVDQDLRTVRDQINELDDYFLGEGRTHRTIAYNMFDYNNESAIDKAFINAKYVLKGVDTNVGWNPLKATVEGLKTAGGTIDLLLVSGIQGVSGIFNTFGLGGVSDLFGMNDYDGYKTSQVIMGGLDLNDRDHQKFLYRRYKGLKDDEFLERRGMNNPDVKSWMKDYQFSIDTKKILEWKDYNDREMQERLVELNSDLTTLKSGSYSIAQTLGIIPFVGDWLRDKLQNTEIGKKRYNFFDPDGVPELFAKDHEKYGESIGDLVLHPLHGLVELSSTIGLYKHQLSAIGVDGAVRYVSRKLPVWAGGPEGWLAKTLIGTDMAVGFNAAILSRKDETRLEAILAMGERVLLESRDKIDDISKITALIDDGLRKRGIRTNVLGEDLIIKLGIAYNIPTDNLDFNNAVVLARKGINKLINANNALAIVDYLQALPFMSYSGDVLKLFTKGRNAFRSENIVNKLYPIEKYRPNLLAAIDHAIDRIAVKYIAKDASKALTRKHLMLWLADKARLSLIEGTLEGVEEVNQELLLSRYQRGLYDQYDHNTTMFEMGEFFGNIGLTSEALPDYFGIHPWDPELSSLNIRKAFNIGFGTSIVFSNIMHAGTNILDDPSKNNLRQLRRQIKDDKIVNRLVANYAGQILDQLHLNIFYEAFRHGASRVGVQKALIDLRNMVDENNTLVKKDFVNEDIRMANAVWAMYDNLFINDHLNENGIKRFSNNYRELVVQGAKAIIDAQKTKELVRDGVNKFRRMQNDHIALVEEMLQSQYDPERLAELESESPELANIVRVFSREYDNYIASREGRKNGKLSGFSRRLSSIKDFEQNEGVKDYIATAWASPENEDLSYDQVVDKVFYNNKLRKEAIKHAFHFENRNKYGEKLQDWEEFRRNKYIRQKVRESINSSFVSESDVESKLWHIFDDKDSRNLAISDAYDLWNFGTYSKESYITERVRGLHQYFRMKVMERAILQSADQAHLISEYRRITGLDVDPTRLLGILSQLKKSLDEAKKNEDLILNGKRENRTPGQRLLTFDDFFGDKNVRFDDQKEFEREFGNLILNRAILVPQNTLASMFMNGLQDPISLKEAIFGDTETTLLDDEESQFREKINEESQIDKLELDVTQGSSEAIRHDKKKLSQKASWKIIKKYIEEAEERHRIANRLFLEEETEDELGDEKAGLEHFDKEEQKEELKEEPEKKQDEKKKPVKVSAEEDPNEKRLQERYNHRTGKKTTVEERAEKRSRRYADAEVKTGENIEEQEEDETPDIVVEDESIEDAEIISEEVVQSEQEQPKLSPNALSFLNDIQNFTDKLIIHSLKTYNTFNGMTVDEIMNVILELSSIPEYYLLYKDRLESIKNAILKYLEETAKPRLTTVEETEDGDPTVVDDSSSVDVPKQGGLVEKSIIPQEDSKDKSELKEESNEELEQDEEFEPDIEIVDEEFDQDELSIQEDIVQSGQEEVYKQQQDELDAVSEIMYDGWVVISGYDGLEYNEDGVLIYEGEVLPEAQADSVEEELSLMSMLDAGSITQEDLPNGKHVEKNTDKRVLVSYDTVGDYISQTFFYQPEPEIDDVTGEVKTVILKVNGEELKLNKPVAPGSELAKKLVQPGWLESTKKYYVVSQSLLAKNTIKGSDPRDAFTVALVIEDDNNCYITTLRALGLTESDGKNLKVPAVVNSETNLRNSLKIRHVNWSKILKPGEQLPNKTSEKVKLFEERTTAVALELAKAWYFSQKGTTLGFDAWWNVDPKRENFAKNEEGKWRAAVAERRRLRNTFLNRAKQQVALPGKRLLTDKQIDEQINKLRENRNAIIEKYCKKLVVNGKVLYIVPKTVRTDIVPIETVQSNGKINNQKKDFNPVYRTISNSEETIEDVQRRIDDGDIVLGLGLGMFAAEGDEFKIRGLLDKDATTEYNGKGLSGKIYWMVHGPAKGSKRVPVMLAEELFDTQVRIINGQKLTLYLNNKDNLKLCLEIDPLTGQLVNTNTEGYLPSAAEILFYMLTDKFDIGLGDFEQRREIVEFFIHNDEKTLLKNLPKSGNDPFGILAEKQLAWHIPEGGSEYVLTIGITENGITAAKDFTQEDLFANTLQAEHNRKTVIHAIATQMHWNTDVAHMNSKLTLGSQAGSGMSFFLLYMIQKYANKDFDNVEDYLNQEVLILGCPQLSFRIGDFYKVKEDAEEWEVNAIEPKQDVSVLAWMIKTGKIKTDAGELVFKDPFVFATGVKNEANQSGENFEKIAEQNGDDKTSDETNILKEKKKSTSAPLVSEEFSLYDLDLYDEMIDSWNEGVEQKRKRSGWYVAKTEEERQKVIDSINNTKGAKDNGGINDRIMFRAPIKRINPGEIELYIEKKIKSFLEKYNKQYPDRAVKFDDVNIPLITKELAKSVYCNKKGFMILDLYKNGKGSLIIKKDLDPSAWNNPVTGIFSKTKSALKFDINYTRKWLSEKLGIDEGNVIVLDGVMRSFTNEAVYGVTNVSLDKISEEITGYIMLSKEGGQGVTYHEAWHYVNLLMHDRKTRDRIYDSYLKANPKLNKKGVTFKDVEEAIAEDFRKYMEGFTSKGVTGAIRRLYNNILDFVLFSRRKNIYMSSFKAIRTGKYAKAKLDLESVAEFRSRYEKGVNKVTHDVSGVSRETLDKMPHINSYLQFFDTTLSVINKIFSELKIRSVEKARQLSGKDFGIILSTLDEMIRDQVDDDAANRLLDVRNNPEVLKRLLIEEFMELGIRAKIRKAEDVRETTNLDEISEDVLKKEESPVNDYDKFDLSISKKDNAAFNVKLFLRCIPVARRVPYEDGTFDIIYERDEYGTIELEDFSESWNKILETLWEANSLDDRDDKGNYKADSMMGIIDRERKTEAFWEVVYKRLEELNDDGEYGDIQLRSLLWATINSNKQRVSYIGIKNPEVFDSIDEALMLSMSGLEFEEDNGVVADRLREWSMKDDSLVSAARNIPRKWSKKLASNGLLDFDEEQRKSVISKVFVSLVSSKLENIKKRLKNNIPIEKKGVVPKTEKQIRDVLNGTTISGEFKKLPKNTDDFLEGEIVKVKDKYYSVKNSQWIETSAQSSLKNEIVEFLNNIGILSDIPSLTVLISMFSDTTTDTLTPKDEINALYRIFNSSKPGSITFIINSLIHSVGREEITKEALGGRSKYGKGIDEAFNDFKSDSDIGKFALAWNAIHPSSLDFCVKGPNGEMLYPIGQNNLLSDRIRALNTLGPEYVSLMQQSHYCRHSIIADAAKKVNKLDSSTKLILAPFVGLKDENVSRGADYFGINAKEDYLAKLFMTDDEENGDLIILPTMADKKTWYSIRSSNIKLSHDTMLCTPLLDDINKHIYEEYEKISPYDKDSGQSIYRWQFKAKDWYYALDVKDPIRKRIFDSATNDLLGKMTPDVGFSVDNEGFSPRFQIATLDRFAGYFLDELDSLLAYYSKGHIKQIVNSPNSRIKNFHGKVKNGRLDFSGNGGKFRYFYDVKIKGFEFGHNLNLHLEGLFELQKKIEKGGVRDLSKNKDDIFKFVGTSILSKNLDDLDGFELVREFLLDLRRKIIEKDGSYSKLLYDALNQKLISQTYKELDRISTPGSPIQLAKYDSTTGIYLPTAIPELLLKRYTKILQKAKFGPYGNPYERTDLQSHALFSLIANHVANTATSIIEVEKMFTGDSAFYKKAKNKKNPKSKIVIDYEKEGLIVSEEVSVENLDDVYSDKIKRLGGTESPGAEIRLVYSKRELEYDPTLKSTKYTNLNVDDLEVPSAFLKSEIEPMFRTLLLVDYIRSKNPKEFEEFISILQKNRDEKNKLLELKGAKTKDKITKENAIDIIYSDRKYFEKMFNMLPKEVKDEMEDSLLQQLRPYKNITVSDAQVFIRPSLYRKIRIGLGDWSFEPDETGYCDEDAYNILENEHDYSWMKDPEKYAKVKKLLLYPLKMSYFLNDPHVISQENKGKRKVVVNLPIYNKMAIFPLFEFLTSSEIGRALYKRMNLKGNELDMISFKSAVKVGASQRTVNLTTENEDSVIDRIRQKKGDPSYEPSFDEIYEETDVQNAISSLGDVLNKNSSKHVDYNTNEEIPSNEDDALPVMVQDLSNLRMQLNTKAHEADIRAIGTQMFKIAFSNIIDDALYGTGKSGQKTRKGSEIKRDIISCINKLTMIGVLKLRDRFYVNGELNDREITAFIKSVVESNGLGSSAQDIIQNGGIAAGLMSRTVFEHSASSIVNAEVVNINTKGGTAIQQSIFGFAGYGNGSVAGATMMKDGVKVDNPDYNGYLAYNGGKELKWSAKEGSMLILLSLNFFKSVVPLQYLTDYHTMRNWLIEHNIIGENAKPFGIGYRIPTQGMSSMFAFQVADVLPEQVGDLIVVPREFTAQTGSDFDVDKLFLATFSYRNGKLETAMSEQEAWNDAKEFLDQKYKEYKEKYPDNYESMWELLIEEYKETKDLHGGLLNRLLLDYIDIISDKRNYANARGSIDVITNKLHDDLLDPVLKELRPGYIDGMTELLPSFLALRKMEFGVGKSGIGPFALNITNLALTQYINLDMNYGIDAQEYGFGKLNAIYGRDNQRISDWLSAMVNAHVDVAKDPYVFDLNVNQFTYNHANFLLRAGMGLGTFTFLAQPALKLYADDMNNAGGIYGGNIDGSTPESAEFESKRRKVYRKKINFFLNRLKGIGAKYENILSENQIAYLNLAIEYFTYITLSKQLRIDKGYNEDNIPISPIKRNQVFDEELAKSAILNYRTPNLNVDDNEVFNLIQSITFLLASLLAFDEINKYAQELSKLVQCSQIDTKKFGNNIASHINFINKYEQFKFTSELWTIDEKGFELSVPAEDPEKGPSRKEISREALKRYFGRLYLDKKLYNATRYTREILSKLTFIATDTFQDLFKNIAAIINGKVEYKDFNGNTVDGYNVIYKDEVVQTLAKGIDNIMRFNSFMSDGYKIYENEVKKGNEDILDFTCGGNVLEVRQKMKDLIYGTDDQESIFKRLASLIKDIKKNPYDEKYDGLADDEGEISNDILTYLDPQTPTSKYPIGRMLLESSQMFTSTNKKRRLVSAFDLLLSHHNEEIKQLARDLAFYAYFSAYDQNTTNAFFDLVPPKYRALYDHSLKYTICGLSSQKKSIYRNALESVTRSSQGSQTSNVGVIQQAASDILDIISRNYWYDDNVVPVHYLSDQSEDGLQASQKDPDKEITGATIYDSESGKMFPNYIISGRVRNSSMYIKIRKGSGTYLYKKVGTITRTHTDEDGNTRTGSPFDVYIVVPKAGLHKGKINQYELYCDYDTPSIFKENKLPFIFAEDNVRKSVESIVNIQKEGYYSLELTWDTEQVTASRRSDNSDVYLEQVFQSSETETINGLSVRNVKDGERTGQNNGDIIINFVEGTPQTKEDADRINIRKGIDKKVIDVSITEDMNAALDEIKNICSASTWIHITTSLFDSQISITQDQIELFINNELRKIPEDIDDLEKVKAAKRKSLEKNKYAESAVKLQIIDSKLHEFIQGLVLRNVKINRITSAASKGKTRLAKALSYVNLIDNQYIENKNIVYADSDLVMRKNDMNKFLRSMDRTSAQISEQETVEEQVQELVTQQIANLETESLTLKKAEAIINKWAGGEMATQLDDTEQQEDEFDFSIVEEQTEDSTRNQECSGAKPTNKSNKFASGVTASADDMFE